jgi:hypothetical protein
MTKIHPEEIMDINGLIIQPMSHSESAQGEEGARAL